jgi:hypothetical protein
MSRSGVYSAASTMYPVNVPDHPPLDTWKMIPAPFNSNLSIIGAGVDKSGRKSRSLMESGCSSRGSICDTAERYKFWSDNRICVQRDFWFNPAAYFAEVMLRVKMHPEGPDCADLTPLQWIIAQVGTESTSWIEGSPRSYGWTVRKIRAAQPPACTPKTIACYRRQWAIGLQSDPQVSTDLIAPVDTSGSVSSPPLGQSDSQVSTVVLADPRLATTQRCAVRWPAAVIASLLEQASAPAQ